MKNRVIKVATVTVLAACYVTMLVVFFLAYLSPLKTLRIGIDVYGEANLEALILLLSLPLCVKYLYHEFKSLLTKK